MKTIFNPDEKRLNEIQILQSENLKNDFLNLLMKVYNNCKEDETYRVNLAYRLQKDLELSAEATMNIISRGIQKHIFRRTKDVSPNSPCIRFVMNRKAPSKKTVTCLLTDSKKKNNDFVQANLVWDKVNTEAECIQQFKDSIPVKAVKDFGYEIKLTKKTIKI